MKKLLVILLLIVAVGCAKKYQKPSEEGVAPDETVTEDVITYEEVDEEVVDEITVPEDETVLESTLSVEEQAKSVFKDVLFDYDKYDIRPDSRPSLDAVADFLNKNKDINIVVEGHCDERGTNEYNLALGEKRAKAAQNYLTSQGVSKGRIIAITFGEEKPVCTEPTESCWQNNRRAHFVIVKSRFQ